MVFVLLASHDTYDTVNVPQNFFLLIVIVILQIGFGSIDLVHFNI